MGINAEKRMAALQIMQEKHHCMRKLWSVT
jgi:hypothetical protein